MAVLLYKLKQDCGDVSYVTGSEKKVHFAQVTNFFLIFIDILG